ncbi:lipocalin family protein [Mariniflexile sp. HNIBRBA6329]|uniref:lipocalin family protein n=1 Tax=Mariniflexile sp. HNIBRBA6329 TaxID=3373088 RepID=UPI003746B6EC
MKPLPYLIIAFLCLSCSNKKTSTNKESEVQHDIVGTWKMIYAEIKKNDSLEVKNLSKSSFIKIINNSHFSFFNQDELDARNSYGGAGTYSVKGNQYVETLIYTSAEAIRNHVFTFTIKIAGDTLIQSGIEEVKKAGIKQEIIEKYIRIN